MKNCLKQSMQIQIKKSATFRRTLRSKLKKYHKLHNAAISIHGAYCSLTGFMHMLPDFYIIGAAKCGTTSLYQYLIQHPSVNPGIGKEIHYFEELYYRGENWYRACFPFKFQKSFFQLNHHSPFITGDSTPRYFDHPHVPKRIQKLTPNEKFIVMLRNPIDRAFSHYNMNLKNQYESLSFEEAVKKEPERIRGEFEKMEKSGKTDYDYYLYAYLDRGIYVDRLIRWMNIFPKKNFLIIKSEDFFDDTSYQYNMVLKFLGLPPLKMDDFKLYMIGKYNEKQIETKLRTQLKEFFEPHNKKLYEFLGKKFDWEET